jgi:hypothetical protein
VLWDAEHRNCPTPHNNAAKHLCFWPSRLGLQITAQGGRFDVAITAYHEIWVPLPGGSEVWPVEVTRDGTPLVVVERNGRPAVRLAAGTSRITGAYRWKQMPQSVPVPPQIGLLALTLDGQPVDSPSWGADGVLWLRRTATTEETDKDFLSRKIYAVLEDGIPMWLRTEIELTVSGKSREETIGVVLPEGWRLAAVESEIPVAIDVAGQMKAQVRAGEWKVRAHAFRIDNPKEFRYGAEAKPASPEQLIGFRGQPDFRMLEITGDATLVDATQTTFPGEWRDLPVYRWDTSTAFTFEERMRGMGAQPPPPLRIRRQLWLDEDGRGLTFRDRIEGSMQKLWRLDVAEGQQLGSVRSGEAGQLITRNPQTGAAGVEVRTRTIALEATGRMDRTPQLPASGWRADAEAVTVDLNLPAGWRLLALFGADWSHGDWLTRWTLLDLFLLLVLTMAVFRLWGLAPAALAFTAFGLSFHEPDAPRFSLLVLLAPVALLRVVTGGWGRRLLLAFKAIAVAIFLLILVPFVATQVQSALYPQLEMAGTRGFFGPGAPQVLGGISDPSASQRETVDKLSVSQAAADPEARSESPQDAAGLGDGRLNAKLNRIILPRLEFREATIREAIDYLAQQSRELDTTESDPARRGVNIVFKQHVPQPDDARITVSLTNISLMEALRYVTGLANMKFRIEPHEVAIVPLATPSDVLQSKEYSFRTGFFGTRTSPKEVLVSQGVGFPPGASAHITATGRLLVRNTQENLDMIDTLLSALSEGSESLDPFGYKARIQTGPAVPEFSWRRVNFGWNGPVQAGQEVRLVLIPAWLQRIITVLRVALLLGLAAVLLDLRGLGAPLFRRMAKAAAVLLAVWFASGATASAQFPEKEMLDTLRQRLLKPSDAFPNAADIPSVVLTLDGQKIIMEASIHVAATAAVPLPGRLPAWSPASVLVDDKPEAVLRREDGFLWVVLSPGVHRVRVEGLLPNVGDWQWTYLLKPRQVRIEAPGWNVTGVRANGVPDQQVFFTPQQKASASEATYERQDLQPAVAVERVLELGLIWQVRTTVRRLAESGKAVALRLPLLPGENVVSEGALIGQGFIEVRLGAQERSFTWRSQLPISDRLTFATRTDDAWAEQWEVVASPVWNVAFSGLPPIFASSDDSLSPIWKPWPGEKVEIAISRPEPIAGATATVGRGTHSLTIGRRQRTSQLDLSVRSSIGQDFLVELPAEAQITALNLGGRPLPVRKEGPRVVVPITPGDQEISLAWKIDQELAPTVRGEAVRLPVDAANLSTTMRVPENRWVLWAHGPQQGPAVRFWVVLLCALLAAWALGRAPASPLRTHEWALLTIGLTQVPLVAALFVIGWLFLLAWRGRETFPTVRPILFNLLQVLLIGLTAIALGILVFAVGEGLLGDPQMFIRGNGSSRAMLEWYQARVPESLPQPGFVSVSIWWFRLLMLLWALWLAAALIRWLKWAWVSFSTGGAFRGRVKAVAVPPRMPM